MFPGTQVAKFGKEVWERINGQDPHEKGDNKQSLFGSKQETQPKLDPPVVQVS